MNFIEIIQAIGVYYAALVTFIILILRTVSSLAVYKRLGEWKTEKFIDGLFKQGVLYGVSFVVVTLMIVCTRIQILGIDLKVITAAYYSFLSMIVIFTIGKLTILVRYALDQGGSLEAFIAEEKDGDEA